MAWTHAILQLQEADLELLKNRQRLAELNELLKDTASLRAAQQAVETATAAAKQARIAQETLEFELSKIQAKFRVDTDKLYSGRITNARELQDLQAETESVKRHIAAMEDTLLEAMMEREEADDQLAHAARELDCIRAETMDSQQHLTEEQVALTTRNADLTNRMEALKEQIPPAILDTYEYLKPRTANIPVAVLKDQVCSICGIDVIKPVQQLARRNQEAYCGGCNRLLVVLD